MAGPEELRRLRLERNYSQEELAREVGVTLGAVSQWERGVTTPRRGRVEAADQALAAGGRLLRAFGYGFAPPHDEPIDAGLRSEMDALRKENERILARLDSLDSAGDGAPDDVPSSPLEGLTRSERRKRWKDVGRCVSARMKELEYDSSDVSLFTRLTEPFVIRVMKGNVRGDPDLEYLRRIAIELWWSEDSIELILEGGEPDVLLPGDPAWLERRDLLRKRLMAIVIPDEMVERNVAMIDRADARKRAEAEADEENKTDS